MEVPVIYGYLVVPKGKRHANKYMLWIRIIYVSEIANIGGDYIPMDRLQGQ